jgi:hypothetical protein
MKANPRDRKMRQETTFLGLLALGLALSACASGRGEAAAAPRADRAAPNAAALRSDGYDAPELGAAPGLSDAPAYQSVAYSDLPAAPRRTASLAKEAPARASSPYFTKEPAAEPAAVPPAPRPAYAAPAPRNASLPDLDEIVVTDDRPRRVPVPQPEPELQPERWASAEAAMQDFEGETRSVMEDVKRPAPSARLAPAPAPQPPARAGGYALHLASYRAEEQAARGWDVLTQDFPMLARLEPRRTRIDLPDQGAFVRLIAGPFGSGQEAEAACGAVEAEGGYCAVVPFGGSPL